MLLIVVLLLCIISFVYCENNLNEDLFRNSEEEIKQINLSTHRYNETDAFGVMFYASASYCLDWLKAGSWGCRACQYNKMFQLSLLLRGRDDTFGIVGVDSIRKQIVIAFKGTNPKDWLNWYTDLSYKSVAYPEAHNSNVLVHNGFYNNYKSMQASMMLAVQNATRHYPGFSLLLTGHSMGGAHCVFAALDLLDRFNLPLTLYTYGQPRVGNVAFAAYATAKFNKHSATHYRVIHNRDPVPHVPLRAMHYEHVGTEVWYNEAMTQFKVCNGSGEDQSCSDGSAAINVNDHIRYWGVHVGTDCMN